MCMRVKATPLLTTEYPFEEFELLLFCSPVLKVMVLKQNCVPSLRSAFAQDGVILMGTVSSSYQLWKVTRALCG